MEFRSFSYLHYYNIITFQDIDECTNGEDECDALVSTCNNLPSTYECVCNTGYEMNTELGECQGTSS